MKLQRFRRCRGEDGVFLLLWAFLLVALFTMVAIVIDLGALRADRRTDRAAADAAAAAGANELPDLTLACTATLQYALRNLGFAASPVCTFPACDPLVIQQIPHTEGDHLIRMSYPVPNGHVLLLGADAVGGDIPQSSTPVDGNPCDRIGVEISYKRASFFAGIAGIKDSRTTVHSVAVLNKRPGHGIDTPALVALNKTDCETINAGTGKIIAQNNADKAAIMHADSDGSGCGTTPPEYVLSVKNSSAGDIRALPGTGGQLGELGYFSPTAKGYRPGSPARYIGTLARLTGRTTRNPVDATYHCLVSNDGCASSQVDYYDTGLDPYATGPQSSFQQFTDGTDDCSNPPASFAAGNWYIDCPDFKVDGTVTFAGGGVIVITGNVPIKGELRINTSSHQPDTPVGLPTTGLPIPTSPQDTLLVIRGTAVDALALSNTTSKLWMARTTVFNVNGGMSLQGGSEVRWTPPEGGSGKNLIYWNESGGLHSIQGTPLFRADGVFFAGNSALELQGVASLDATNVQMWLDRAEVQGNGTLLLKPNIDRAVKIGKATTSLIR